jgi:hypothetical protein
MGAFNGAGTFVRSFSWVADKTNGIDITSSRCDTEDNGFASGLSLCVTRDGQGAMAANFVPSVAASYDLGSAGVQWRNVFLSGNATVGGNANVTGNLVVAGAAVGFNIPQIFQKQTPTTITSSTTAAIDPALQASGFGAGTYLFELLLLAGSTTNGGLAATMNLSTSVTHGAWATHGSTAPVAGYAGITIGGTPALQEIQAVQAAAQWYRIEGYFCTSSNTGNTFGLYWAQNTSNATGTTLAAGSYMKLTQVNTSFF